MPKRTPTSDAVQLDLFAPAQPSAGPEHLADLSVTSKTAQTPPLQPVLMSDAQLLAEFPNASVATVSSLGDELVKRRPAGWQRATFRLWIRFLGFGGGRPTIEQEVILNMAITTADRELVEAIVAQGHVLPCFEPFLLRAAAASRAAMSTRMVEAGLCNERADVRIAALRLSMTSGVSLNDVYPSLTDPVREVRREAAIVLAEAGEEEVRDMLLFEMRVRPSRPVLEALSCIANEDVVIRLGQFARQNPDWCEMVIAVLEAIDHPKAGKVAASLITQLPDRSGRFPSWELVEITTERTP